MAPLQTGFRSQPEIEFAHELVVVELFGGAALEGDLAVDDDVAAVGDADRLVEVLFGHQQGQLVAVLQLLHLLQPGKSPGAKHELISCSRFGA
jgi:hypothetical protein